MTKKQMIVFATSLNQIEFAKKVVESEFQERKAILLIGDPTTYNEIPNYKYEEIEKKGQSKWFEKIIYLNKLIDYENLNNFEDFIKLGDLLEEKGVRIRDVDRVLIGLLSSKLYLKIPELFYNAKISIYSDGMMSFGPLRGDIYKNKLNQRIDSFYYEDLCDGIEPNYLPELNIKTKKIVTSFGEINASLDHDSVLIALQSLSYSRILTKEEEFHFYSKYINDIVRTFKGKKIYLLPHPNNSSSFINELGKGNVTYLDNSLTGEEYIVKYNIGIVTSVFSTLMFRAKKMGAKCFSFGTDEILLKLCPYENSNRIPIILARNLFLKFDGLETIGSTELFKERVESFSPNITFVRDMLDACSLLIKPSLKEFISIEKLEILKGLNSYERGLLFSKGGVDQFLKFSDYKFARAEYIPNNKEVSTGTSSGNQDAKKIKDLNEKVTKLEKQIKEEKERREKIKNSLSWKITLPIRYIGNIFK